MVNFKDLLKSEFKVTDLGNLHLLWGIQIKYREYDIALSQFVYIDTILKCFSWYDCNLVTYPLDKNHQINKVTTFVNNSNKVNIKLYQQIVRSLIYTVIRTWSDIAFTLTHLS